MKTTFKQIYDRMSPTQEEQIVITKFIQDCVDNGYERFIQNRPKERGRKILKFFLLPKTELHQRFKDVILTAEREEKVKKRTYLVKREMQDNLDKLQSQYPDDWFKYEYLNRFSTAEDNFLRIAVPVVIQGKIKNACTMVISQKETPNLYLMFM